MVKWLIAGVVTLAVVAGLVVFEPWRAFTSSTLDEALPVAGGPALVADTTPTPTPSASAPPGAEPTRAKNRRPRPVRPARPAPTSNPTPIPTPTPAPAAPAPGPRVLASGAFEDAEHGTSGQARVIELADGQRFVRLEGLDTSDGPDLHVWLSSARSGGPWGSYDDGSYVRLGGLKATRGNQNYAIPRDARLQGLRSVVIWCDRFNVAFGTAPIAL